MNTINIAIVEDQQSDRDILLAMISQFKEETPVKTSIHTFSSGESFLSSSLHPSFHIIFMDIYLCELDGIETITKFQSIQKDALIVFLTSSEEDIWRAVRTHGCFDYIRKADLDFDRFATLFHDIIKELDILEKTIEFQSGKQTICLKTQDIQYVTSRDKYILVVFEHGIEKKYRFTFSQFYELVQTESCWLLCNRGILLNMNYVQQSDGIVFIMKNGMQFPIRGNDRKIIIQRFEDYQFERLEKQELFL